MLKSILERYRSCFFAGILGILLLGCNNDTPVNTPTEGTVWVELDLNSDAKELRIPLGYKVITAPRVVGERVGHKGIVVVNGLATAINGDEQSRNFAAYDLVCPNDWPVQVRLEVQTVGLSNIPTAVCPKCHKQYDITLGTGIELNSDNKPTLVSYPIVRRGDRLMIGNR